MKNKRINLTQFEGIGSWEIVERPKAHADDETEYDIKTGRHNASLSEAESIVKLPTLIEELKKLYKREDELRDALSVIDADLKSDEDIRKIKNFVNDVCLSYNIKASE